MMVESYLRLLVYVVLSYLIVVCRRKILDVVTILIVVVIQVRD